MTTTRMMKIHMTSIDIRSRIHRTLPALLTALALSSGLSSDALAQSEDPAEVSADTGRLEHDLVIGENKTLSAVDVKNYSEGAKGIVEVKLTTDKSQFVVVGRRPGSTTLLLIMKDGRQVTHEINVFARSPDTVKRELEALLEGVGGLNVQRLGLRFFIEGAVKDEAAVQRVQRIAALYPGQVESLVSVGAPVDQRQLNIRLDFFFVQYDKRSGYSVGIDWPSRLGGEAIQSSINFDLLSNQTTSATASIVNHPLPALDIAATHGWAKVLRQATVITANGNKANYTSGGEQNFSVANGLTSEIRSIDFGTNVGVLPFYDSESGDIEITVEADVSELVPALSGTTIPGRAISTLNTKVKLKLGQSLVLSGIRSSSERRGSRGLPGLSSLPILGYLFGSQNWAAEDVEGAIFIIPSAVDAVPKPARQMVESALEQFANFSGDLDDVEPHKLKPSDWSSTAAPAPGEPPSKRQ